jgi:hypothetical protein
VTRANRYAGYAISRQFHKPAYWDYGRGRGLGPAGLFGSDFGNGFGAQAGMSFSGTWVSRGLGMS